METLNLLLRNFIDSDVRGLIYQKLDKCDINMIYRALFFVDQKINDLDLANIVARNGYWNLLDWFLKIGCLMDETTCNNAIAGGHLEILKLLYYKGYPLAENCCNQAAANGQLEILQWLHSIIGQKSLSSEIFSTAAANGQLETLKWLYKNDCPQSSSGTYYAVKNGHLETLKWLVSIAKSTLKGPLLICALQNKHLEMAKWISLQPFPKTFNI